MCLGGDWGRSLHIGKFPDIVRDALVVGVLSFDAFHEFHDAYGDGKGDDFIDRFENDLRNHHGRQDFPGHNAA